MGFIHVEKKKEGQSSPGKWEHDKKTMREKEVKGEE